LAKQGFVKYTEGSEFLDTREDLIDQGDPEGGGLKELDEKLAARIENLKDMVLYRFGSTGVVQVLSRAAELLGLVPVFPVRNVHTFTSGSASSSAAFRDCVLVRKGSTVGDVYRKVMGDAPMAYVETVGGVRVAEDDAVGVGKNDVSFCEVVCEYMWRFLTCGRSCRLRLVGREYEMKRWGEEWEM
jgi:ribosome-binding ATPase YchF (GTP1/OBG family)